MPSLTSDVRFFGIDLKQLGRQLRQPWEGASTWRVFSWLSPQVSVRVLRAEGSDVRWVDGKPAAATPATAIEPADGSGFVAVEVPEDMVLRRAIRLPAMSTVDRESALALEARSASPFASSDLVWGAAPMGTKSGTYAMVLASRKHLLAYQHTLGARVPVGVVPEQWVFSDHGPPVVFTGFGEQRRFAFVARWRRTALILLGGAALIGVAIAVTPSVKLKLRANQAHGAYNALAQKSAPVLERREALVKSADQLSALQKLLEERIEPLRLLDALTRAIPDDAALQSLKLHGTKVTLTGYAANAASLMQILGSQPGLRDVRAPSAATRISGAEKESFVIEFTADPAHFGVVGGPPVAAVAASSTALVEAPATASQTAPETGPSVAATPAPTVPPPSAAGAASGGKAVFGGTTRLPAGPVAAPSGEGGK